MNVNKTISKFESLFEALGVVLVILALFSLFWLV